MRIALIDVDFNENIAFTPNPWLMKVSSYYKQLDYKVSLLEKVGRPESFDQIIIAKELQTAFLPSLSLLTNKRTKLIGAAFRRQKNFWQVPEAIHKARPDYGLYKFKFPTEFTNASFINSSYKGKLIKVQRQERTERESAVNFIIDKGFWDIENLGEALDQLSEYNKLIFLEEVDIKKLNNDELIKKFVNLRLFKRPIKLKKVVSLYELEEAIKVLNKVNKLKALSYEPQILITMASELDAEQALSRYFECIRAAALANKYMINIEYLVPREEAFKYAIVFKPFLKYKNRKKSFFTYLLEGEFYIPATEVLSNKQTWRNPVVSDIWRIYFKDRSVFEDGFIGWGGHPDQIRKEIDIGDAKIFYDTYIL